MKKIMMKTMLATALLAGSISGQVGSAHATAAKPTAAPIMRDNLSKFGLVKDVELPVTVTAGGLSYTLEKIMIFDAKSKDAQALAKQYGYNLNGTQYFIWTKITVENKGGNVVQQNIKDLSDKWRLNFGDLLRGEASSAMPDKLVDVKNSKDALWDWTLKPGQKLSTYQGFRYTGTVNYFKLSVDYKGQFVSKYIVEPEA
ncbi:hypothetical protein [Paenibacillus sp. FSL R7-0333]|uniref:hypothetical protein n=1 Tax=Paenibacillus sp. FSL R7-0333 TaxID=1926587 RepID=UPI00096CDD28|nr:hypothetical protein BK146_25520 [Paenibacillus sp. FSL R7-0333]